MTEIRDYEKSLMCEVNVSKNLITYFKWNQNMTKRKSKRK